MAILVIPYGLTVAVLVVTTRSWNGGPCGSRLIKALTGLGRASANQKAYWSTLGMSDDNGGTNDV